MNKHLKLKGVFSLFFGFIVVAGGYMWFIQTPYFSLFKAWAEQNVITLSIFLVIVKVIGIVIPPIPGGILTLGAIPILGWWQAYVLDFTGAMIGSAIAYYLGKKYGNKLLSKFFDQALIEKMEHTKIKKNRQIESVFLLRFLFGSTIVEIVCYAAGLLKITFRNFMIGSIISHVVLGLPTYYLANNLLELKNLWLSAAILAVGIPFVWKLKGRYIEYME
jgi:uncharacterized membrane protein YdjX (TVP38/TMEM64 family)